MRTTIWYGLRGCPPEVSMFNDVATTASAKLPPLAARISKAGDCTPGGSFRRGPASASGRASAGYADRGHVSRRLLQIQFPIVVHCSGCRRASVFVKYPLPKGHSIQPSSLKRPTHDSPGLAVSGYVSCFCDARSVKARARTRARTLCRGREPRLCAPLVARPVRPARDDSSEPGESCWNAREATAAAWHHTRRWRGVTR